MNGAILSLENQLFSFMTNSNALKHNKWEKNESGLKFGEDGFTVNSNAPKGFKTVSAEFPIRLFNIVGMVKRKCVPCYFEVKLVNGSNVEKTIRVGIGFCGQDFPLDGVGIGGRSGSIGLYCPEGMSIDGQLMPFEEQNVIPIDTNFRKGDIVGCGLLYSPTDSTLRCFATLRGKFIGSILLRPKYHTRMLYPAASLYFDQESIRANFGAQPFHFNPSQLLDK